MGIGVLFIGLLVLLFTGVPIMASLLGASFASAAVGGQNMLAVVQRYFTSVDSFSLIAVAFFMLSGAVMEKGGVSKRLIRLILTDFPAVWLWWRSWRVLFSGQSAVLHPRPWQPSAASCFQLCLRLVMTSPSPWRQWQQPAVWALSSRQAL